MTRKQFLLLAPGAADSAGDKSKPAPQQMSQDEIAKELDRLRGENARLITENEELAKKAEIMPGVKERMEAGLTREQAESVERQQIEHDKRLAEIEADQEKARKTAKK